MPSSSNWPALPANVQEVAVFATCVVAPDSLIHEIAGFMVNCKSKNQQDKETVSHS